MGWEMSHLSGIQRSIIGINKGWGSPRPRTALYRYDRVNDCFVNVSSKDLPALIRLNLENQEWIEVASTLEQPPPPGHQSGQQIGGPNTQEPVGAKGQTAKKGIIRGLAGKGGATEELIHAISATNLAL